MADTDKDFGGTSPTTTAEDGWQIIDSGMERESVEDVSRVLAESDGDVTPPPSATPEEPQDAETVTGGDDDPPPAQVARPAQAPQAPKAGEKPRRQLSTRAAELRGEVDRLTAEKHRERAELERLRAERKKLEEGGTPAPRTAATAPAPAAKTGEPLKKPTWKEFEEADKSWDEYVAAQDAYLEQRIEQSAGAVREAFRTELAALREESEMSAHQARIEAGHKARMSLVRDAHKDEWPEILSNLEGIEVAPFIEDVIRMHPKGAELFYKLGKDPDAAQIANSLDWTTTMFDAIMAIDDPSALLLYLATTDGEFERIRQMPPARASFALGVLSRQLDSEPAPARVPGSRPQGKAISKAPAPIRPVGGASTASDTTTGDGDDENFDAWFAKENERDQKRALAGRRFGA